MVVEGTGKTVDFLEGDVVDVGIFGGSLEDSYSSCETIDIQGLFFGANFSMESEDTGAET
jgi:hypothetical protein